jgi:osmotically-inducible protein OsmY
MENFNDDLELKIEQAIMDDDAYEPSWKVDALDDNGVITLNGAVPTQDARNKVESIARKQTGVVSVINEIDVDPDLKHHPADKDFDEDDVEVPPSDISPLADQ